MEHLFLICQIGTYQALKDVSWAFVIWGLVCLSLGYFVGIYRSKEMK